MTTITDTGATASARRDDRKQIRRYIVDFEFNVRPRSRKSLPEIISVAIVSLDDGRELYLESAEFDERHANPFVRDFVLPRCAGQPRVTLDEMRDAVRAFCSHEGTTPEFWGYMCAHDFVLLESLFGDFTRWPQGWPFLMHDIEAWRLHMGIAMPQQVGEDEHNSLADARFLAGVWRRLAVHPLNAATRRLVFRWDEPSHSFFDVRAPLDTFLKNTGAPDWEGYTRMGEPDRVYYRSRTPERVVAGE